MGPKKRKAVKQTVSSDSGSHHSSPTQAQQDEEVHKTSVEKIENEVYAESMAKLPMNHIPTGPDFQTDVPDVTEVLDLQNYRELTEGSKWMGTRVWPLEAGQSGPVELGINADIGRGRLVANCGCRGPGSVQCVRLHVSEKREQLKDQLGPAFNAWGFDEMGEDVAKLWNSNMERQFKNIVSSKDQDFLQPNISKRLRKTYKELISYYFNVLVMKRVCSQARKGDPLDSDDDDYVDNRRKSNVSEKASRSSKFLKPIR